MFQNFKHQLACITSITVQYKACQPIVRPTETSKPELQEFGVNVCEFVFVSDMDVLQICFNFQEGVLHCSAVVLVTNTAVSF